MNKHLSAFVIAATYIGTVVGAGFASGQEVLQFFTFFGVWGFVGIVLSTVLFIFFGISILQLGHRLKARSHLSVIRAVGGQKIALIMDIIITFFLFGALVTMAAGSGAIFAEQFNLPAIAGSALVLILTLVTVLLGVSKVIDSISFIAPILLTAVISLSLWTIFSNPQALISNLDWSAPANAAAPYWPVAAVLYTSYNLVLAVAILAPLGALSRPETLRLGAILGGLGLGTGVLAITTAMLTLAPQVTEFEVPMVAVAGSVSPLVHIVYSLVLFAEVYTTAVASLYGFISRLTTGDGVAYKWLSVGACILAFVSSQFGFSTIVGTLFPAVGFAGLLLLGSLTYGRFKGTDLATVAPLPATKPLPGANQTNIPEQDPNSALTPEPFPLFRSSVNGVDASPEDD